MSTVVQHLGRISHIIRYVITTMLLSALVLVPAVAIAQTPSTTHFQVVHTFHGSDGIAPGAGLIMDKTGTMYSTTALGGDLSCPSSSYGCGTLFKLGATGKESVVHRFMGPPDGLLPSYLGNLVQDTDGTFYGTTVYGGVVGGACGSSGCGTVFKVSKAGNETVLYEFTGTNGDGINPNGPILLDKNGDLYGTTNYGGAGGYGTVFQVDKTGQETVLYNFKGINRRDGTAPLSGLVEDKAGNLYGTTSQGGISSQACGPFGCGIVYKVTKTGNETVLYRFTGGNGDGSDPFANLILSGGNLYSTTNLGGTANRGTVFKMTTSGQETVLYSFTGGNDGSQPYSPVVRDSAGNLYGVTQAGGTSNYGVVFELTKTGKEIVLHSFTNGKDGSTPYGSLLLLDSAHKLYGTALVGGDKNCKTGLGPGCGVVFEISQ